MALSMLEIGDAVHRHPESTPLPLRINLLFIIALLSDKFNAWQARHWYVLRWLMTDD